MPLHLVCPGCQQRLIIRDDSPPTVTCPECLALIRNPATSPPSESMASSEVPAPPVRAAPLPVIPLDQEVSEDFQGTLRNLVVLSIVLMAGGILSTVTLDAGIVGSALIALGVVLLIVLSATFHRRRPRPAPTAPAQDRDPRAGPYLEYQSNLDRPRMRMWPFVGGFFGGLALCALAMGLMIGSVDMVDQPSGRPARFAIVALIAAMIIGAQFWAARLGRRRPGWSGIGRGTAIGLALGLMAVGPCAFCYIAF